MKKSQGSVLSNSKKRTGWRKNKEILDIEKKIKSKGNLIVKIGCFWTSSNSIYKKGLEKENLEIGLVLSKTEALEVKEQSWKI